MKIVVIGSTGTIGSAVVRALSGHEVIGVHRNSDPGVDIKDVRSIARLFDHVTDVDAVISCAGGAAWKPLAQLTDADFEASLRDKFMGQVNVIRIALARVRDGGVIVVTSGVLGKKPMPGSGAVSPVNAGLEAFVRAAALEAPRGVRVNAVSPPWVTETLAKLGMDTSIGKPAAEIAKAYVAAVEGKQTGQTIEP